MKRYYLHIDGEKANHAGSKAVDDVEVILDKRGYKKLRMFSSSLKLRLFRRVERFLQLFRASIIPKGSMLVLQHPYYTQSDYMTRIIELKKKRDLKLVFLIHDLESIRRILPQQEVYIKLDELMLQNADVIIAHNNAMCDYLIRERSFDESRVISLGIFDYIMPEDYQIEDEAKFTPDCIDICIAGNLNQNTCAYIYRTANIVPDNIKLKLFGVNFNGSDANDKCNYVGEFSPEELPSKMEGMFGLIWYGNDSKNCGGSIAHYLPYINAHKTSAYIMAGLPVISASNIGSTNFIVNNDLGISIESLEDINTVLKQITNEQYTKYRKNVYEMAGKLRVGYYTNQAFEKAERLIYKNRIALDEN